MDNKTLLDLMSVAERLKCTVRHSWTSGGRRESVAEHVYRLCVFAWLVQEEFPDLDKEKVMEMCLFHDLGEAVTGDIPCFEKKEEDRQTEESAVRRITKMLPADRSKRLDALFDELEAGRTGEAKLVHALDKMEALIQHNEAPIDTWLPLEYDLQLTYGQKEAEAFPYTRQLRKAVEQDSIDKIAKEREEKHDGTEAFHVSRDKEKLDFGRIAQLMRQSYWAGTRSEEMIRKAMEGSVCYGVYDREGYMVGYARIITDFATVFYLMDVIIDEGYRGKGLGTLLMDAVMEDVGSLYGVLHTEDAGAFYERYGFTHDERRQEVLMEKERKDG